MWQAEIRVDLGAIRDNVARLRARTAAQVMAVIKADGYGHGMVPSARAALAGGATWLGACTVPEALALRDAGIAAPALAWLWTAGAAIEDAIRADVDISVNSHEQLDCLVNAARATGRTARTHLKVDTGLNRNGATLAEFAMIAEAAAKAEVNGDLDVVGVWSHFASADDIDNPSIDRQLDVFRAGLDAAAHAGLTPRVRHMANSAALLTRPDSHFDLVRPGIAVYGLTPIAGRAAEFGLTPAMACQARVALVKRVPAGEGVSYSHTYTTRDETTLALVPLGYGDGVPRGASNIGPVWLAGRTRTVAGRVCMDQFVLDCGGDDVRVGDVATLFGSGADGEPTADDWAEAVGTINYEIVTRIGSARVHRVYDGIGGEAG